MLQRTDAAYGSDEQTTLRCVLRRVRTFGRKWRAISFFTATFPRAMSRRSRGFDRMRIYAPPSASGSAPRRRRWAEDFRANSGANTTRSRRGWRMAFRFDFAWRVVPASGVFRDCSPQEDDAGAASVKEKWGSSASYAASSRAQTESTLLWRWTVPAGRVAAVVTQILHPVVELLCLRGSIRSEAAWHAGKRLGHGVLHGAEVRGGHR
jgi:hypothetical protein